MKFIDIIKQVEDNPYSAFFHTPPVYKKAKSYLFLKPCEIVSIYKQEDLEYNLKVVQKLIDKNYFGYTLINYEAGFLFEKKFSQLLRDKNEKLIQCFFFDKPQVEVVKSSKIFCDHPSSENYSINNFKLSRTEDEFMDDIGKIKHFIKEGDTYQVNYTIKGRFNFSGSYNAFLQKLLFNQSAKYSTFINNEKNFILSLSPELFFHKKGRRLIAQPMKGTIRRGYNHNSDKIAETELKGSEKNLAENVMIVDLIRNDFGRLCRYGSIKAPDLFRIEKYESLFQMVSEVKGVLRKKKNLNEILTNIFPCGSVTGAPKIRTMEIINEIEKEERGIYTGSIGLFTPKEIKLNVAIRTISIDKKSGDGIMGLGSGIVWDSDSNGEYEEVQLKSKFLTEPLNYFEIFETMKLENGQIKFLDHHILRMKSAADYFLFKFREKKVRKFIDQLTDQIGLGQKKKIKLLLDKSGMLHSEISDIDKPAKNYSVILSENTISSVDRFRYFKTTNRSLYDNEYENYSKKKFKEVIFLNERDEIVEGSRTNIFIRIGNTWMTPQLNSGALPGIYRKYFLLNHPDSLEQTLYLADLVKADEVILTNAIQEEIKVNRVYLTKEEFISYK